MFNKIKDAAKNVKLIEGGLMEGNVTFTFILSDSACELKVRSHINLIQGLYNSITVSLIADGVPIYHSQVTSKEEKQELVKLLEVLEHDSHFDRNNEAKQIATKLGLWS